MTDKGPCAVCQKRYALRKNGTVRAHDGCEGSGMFPARLPPENPYYCETCQWGDCFDCVEEGICDCMHWCPTALEMADTVTLCAVCGTEQRMDRNRVMLYHRAAGNWYINCDGVGRYIPM